MHLNLSTTISFAAAATCISLAALWWRLGRGDASRHFRYAAAAGFAGAAYCIVDAMIAGRLSVGATLWAGRIGLFITTVHAASWLAFFAAWERRPLSRTERFMIVTSLVAGALGLVPGVSVLESVTERRVEWAGVIYRDPNTARLGSPIMALGYFVQILATVAAFRMARINPGVRVVGAALALFCVVILLDWMSAIHVLDLPYLVDATVALVCVAVGSVVVSDAAESAVKSNELERARVAMAERENLAGLGQLAAVVAHEVRNPVGVIFSALSVLQRSTRGDEEAQLLAIVGEEAERLKQLVARLLETVRPFEIQYTRRAAGDVLRSAIALVTSGTGVDPGQVELLNDPPVEVECDVILLGQAVANLVQNALLADGRRSPVRVSARVESAQPAMLCIAVADDGDGVPLHSRPRLFMPFFTTRATGTGLGLALVKRIAGAHGGTVDYEPLSERGAKFVLRLPLRACDASPRRLLGADVQ